MANYPSIGYDPSESAFAPFNAVKLDRADDGALRMRDLQAVQYYDIKLVHPFCTQAERDTLLATCVIGAVLTLTRAADGQQFEVTVVAPPYDRHVSGPWWSVVVTLSGTAL